MTRQTCLRPPHDEGVGKGREASRVSSLSCKPLLPFPTSCSQEKATSVSDRRRVAVEQAGGRGGFIGLLEKLVLCVVCPEYKDFDCRHHAVRLLEQPQTESPTQLLVYKTPPFPETAFIARSSLIARQMCTSVDTAKCVQPMRGVGKLRVWRVSCDTRRRLIWRMRVSCMLAPGLSIVPRAQGTGAREGGGGEEAVRRRVFALTAAGRLGAPPGGLVLFQKNECQTFLGLRALHAEQRVWGERGELGGTSKAESLLTSGRHEDTLQYCLMFAEKDAILVSLKKKDKPIINSCD
ncbi:hypothetical protein C0Q70_02159 [Pomacea canaliculata]|uniref:Uncharacterized protein n=1 Tax=Pomacea canaliculata TaxID=400727 RepID=A0A2T7Q1H9_POMCA|nr:hypothetical protein C0Q70_02159 [Pomacea canaliculata]